MCGIVGYVGNQDANDYLLEGLQTLEYRGYDSAGIVTTSERGKTTVTKVVGRVSHLREEVLRAEKPKAHIGIGHTRWATHGGVLQKNAHPQYDASKQFFVVHNGIIENHSELRALLQKHGIGCTSDTDTEVVPQLIALHYQETLDVREAFLRTIAQLQGAYAIVMTTPLDRTTLYAAKLSSPMAIGIGKNAHYIGSDALPLSAVTDTIVYMEDGDVAFVKKDGYSIQNSATANVTRREEKIAAQDSTTGLGTYPDFMSKEIHEAAETVTNAMRGRLKLPECIITLGGLESVREQLRHIDRIIIVACGTSYYAGIVGEFLLEEIARIPVEVQQASEFRYRDEPISRSTAVLVLSQSGETADTIAALTKLQGSGILTLGVVNAPGSTLARMTDAGVYCHAGPEKAVASTKAFIAQVTVLTLISLYLSHAYPQYESLIREMHELPKAIGLLLKSENNVKIIAEKYAHHRDFLFIGRRYAYPVALEGALKLKEISYIHAEGFAGGEMKHGPLALIDESFPTFAIALTSTLTHKTSSNLQEIHSRKGPLIVVVDDPKSEAAQIAHEVITVPRVAEPLQPILAAITTHLFAYYAAKTLGRDIDKPRNLAKSVTVE